MKTFNKLNRTQLTIAGSIALLVIVSGIVWLTARAAGFFSAVESDAGTLTTNAKVITDSTASGGTAIQFMAPATTPSPKVITNRPTQSAALAYNGVSGVSMYAKPGGLLVAGRDNYQDAAFKNVSSNGGTVLIYIDPIIDNRYGRYHDIMLNASVCGGAVPRWPGDIKANEWGYLTDFRPGSVLQTKLECVLELMVSENPHMGGWFVDDLGSRSWFPLIDWNAMSYTNKQAYRDGAIAISQTFRKVADRHSLVFIVNGTWGAGSLESGGGGYPDMSKHGNALADGGFVENHTVDTLPYFSAYACSTQWASQSPYTRSASFMYAITRNDTDRNAYINSNCFAFVATQPDYGVVPVPYSTLHYTGLPTGVGPAISF